MKRIVTSVGIAALGAACIQNASAQGIGGDGSKPWTVSASLRGFYDDNINTASVGEIDTFGFEVSPSFAAQLAMDQTTLSFAYTYAIKFYDQKPDPSRSSRIDQTHTIAARLLHALSERTSVSVTDSFVIGQEPDFIRVGNGGGASPMRISGSNIRNFGAINFNHEFTRTFGIEIGYANALYDYDDKGATINTNGTVTFSQSGLLDRLEHSIHLDARWNVRPTTVALVGYQFSFDNYTGDEPIGVIAGAPPTLVMSENRNSRSHYGYAGIEHTFRPDLTGRLRAGARFTDYYKSPDQETSVSPYVNASLDYLYARDSRVQVGISHDLNATDAFSVLGSSITSDQESTVVYASLTHKIRPALSGSLMVQFQNSTFNGGVFDSISEQFYLLSAALEYQVNRHVSATLSYHHDRLESDLRQYDRNRVYLGTTITY